MKKFNNDKECRNELTKLANDILQMLLRNDVDQYGKLLELLYVFHGVASKS